MNDKEKLEMVKLCVNALLEEKELEFAAYSMNGEHWLHLQDINSKNIAVIVERIWHSNYKYRIKPEPKTMQCRVYFEPNTKAILVAAGQVGKGFWDSTTTQWLTDEFTVELPE